MHGATAISIPGCNSAQATAPVDTTNETRRTANCIVPFIRKYFLEGQQLDAETLNRLRSNSDGSPVPWYIRHRTKLGFLLPLVMVWAVWWPWMIYTDNWHLFAETDDTGSGNQQPRWIMTITMVFGSLIAGATSEGGAAVAFPVMTLLLSIPPPVARDFSFMIQSVGMVAAAFTILSMRVVVEWNSLRWVSFGGIFGLIFGIEVVSPFLPPPFTKMLFVGGITTFAFSLYYLNRTHGRVTVSSIAEWDEGVLWRAPFAPRYAHFNWKAAVLFVGGLFGGCVTGVAGSGIDICSFALLTLLFRVSEKVATPTSVVLMAANTLLGFVYRQFVMGGVEHHAWGFFAVCAPVVVIGAPLGTAIGTHFHRLTLAAMVYIIDTAQLFGAVYVVRPWLHKDDGGKTDQPVLLSVLTALIFVCGAIFFRFLSNSGLALLGDNRDKGSAGASPPLHHGRTPNSDRLQQEMVQNGVPGEVQTQKHQQTYNAGGGVCE